MKTNPVLRAARFTYPLIAAGTLGFLACVVGCDKKDSTSVAENKPKFEVESKDKKPTTTESPKPIEAPPTFSPKQTEALAARSYEMLKLPEKQDFESLKEFLPKADLAMRDLMIALRAKGIAEDEFRSRSVELCGLKVSAAEKMMEQASSKEDKEGTVMVMLTSLSQMASLGDSKAARRLESFAKDVSQNPNPTLAHQGELVLYSFLVMDYDGGKLKNAAPLLDAIDHITADKSILAKSDFDMLVRSLSVIEKQGDEDALKAAIRKIGSAFEESPNPELMMRAWQMTVSDSVTMSNFQKALQTTMGGAKGSPELVSEAVNAFVKEFPMAGTMAAVGNSAVQVEYSGSPECAKIMFEAIAPHLESIKNEGLKQDLMKTYDGFQKRTGAFGKPIDFSELNGQDGMPFDPKSLQGKIVLIDFWATWCGPCREEFPNMREVYAEFKDKGLEIVGINLDDEAAEYEAFQTKEQLPWVLVRTSNAAAVGFQTPAAAKVGVSAIPLMILLDRDGNVVAMHTRGPKLREAVAELIEKGNAK